MENIELDILKKKILGEIKRDTNGAVVEVMNDLSGVEQFFSYGVTIVKIKEVAKQYAPNHLLAMALFNSKIRELKLAAIYIDDANEVTEEQIILWSESFSSLEIAEHCSSMLFFAAKNILGMALIWSESNENFLAKAAYLIATKRVKLLYNELELESYIALYGRAIELIRINDNSHAVRVAENFVAAFANKNSEVKIGLINLLESGELGISKDEIKWQLE